MEELLKQKLLKQEVTVSIVEENSQSRRRQSAARAEEESDSDRHGKTATDRDAVDSDSSDTESVQSKPSKFSDIDCEDVESVFVHALEKATQSSWRLVCPTLATEQNEPFRTCLLNKELRNLLELWSTWQQLNVGGIETMGGQSEDERSSILCPQSLELRVDLYQPLANLQNKLPCDGSARHL